jgi:hypothetical protein
LCAFLIVAVSASAPSAFLAANVANDFRDGCCVNPAFPRPGKVSRATVPASVLIEAVNCATNNRLMSGTTNVARELGDETTLRVAYYFGRYMPEQDGKALTIAVYSVDGKRGWLFDLGREGHKYYVANSPELLRGADHWRVGEIDGGLWSYTRLWYLAQEIGSRPRQELLVKTVSRSKPESCEIGPPVWGSRVVR